MTIVFFLVACLIPDYIWLRVMREEMPMKWWMAVPFAVLCHAWALFCAKAFSALEFWSLSGFSGMRLYGVLFFVPALIYIAAKAAGWKMAKAFDILSICVMYCHLIIRLNCLMMGCCGGTKIPGTNGLHWPIRELEMALYVVLLIIWLPRVRRGQTNGEVYPVLMIAYGAVRFVLEWFRAEYVTFAGIWHWAHVWSLLCLCIGLSVYFTMLSRKTYQKGRRAGKRI